MLFAIENIAQLRLDQRTLFLDHHDQIEALGKCLDDRWFQWPHHADLEQPHADARRLHFIDAEIVKRLAHIEITFARSHDADLRSLATLEHNRIDGIDLGERQNRRNLRHMEPLFLRHPVIARANIKAALRQLVVLGQRRHDAPRTRLDDRRGLDRIMHGLEANPHARIARQRKTQEPEIDDLLHAGGAQHRDHCVTQRHIAGMHHGRGFARMIITRNGDNAAVLRRARHIGMTKDVARTVNPRTLAIPDAEHPIEAAFATHLRLLAAPQGSRREVFVEPRLKLDVARVQQRLGRHEMIVDSAYGRTTIAGHIARRIEPGLAVRFRLHEGKTHDRLRARQKHRRFREVVFVIETVHGRFVASDCKIRNLHQRLTGVCLTLSMSVRGKRSPLQATG